MSRVEKYWDHEAEANDIQNRIWMAHPNIQYRLNKLVSGAGSFDKFHWFVEWLRSTGATLPFDRAISIGCGTGHLERQLYDLGLATEIVGVDISQRSIDIARNLAKSANLQGICYRKMDLNLESVSELKSQVILAHMAVHHIENLELFFEGASRSLAPSGFLFMFEYIGPKRFQWSSSQLQLINRLLSALPAEIMTLSDGSMRQPSSMPLEKDMIADDPSESVRSNEIIPVMKDWFDIIGYRSLRGALLHVLMTDITGNLMKSPLHSGYVSLIAEVEDILTEAGFLDDHFAIIIGRPHGWSQHVEVA